MESTSRVVLLTILVTSVSASGCLDPSRATFDDRLPASKYATCAELVSSSDSSNPKPPEFRSAITFASDTKQEYTKFLTDREEIKLGSGLTLIALAGASLGLTTTAANTNAATATGLASGTGLAGYTWVANKAKDTAYTQATNQLQCVLTKASILEPLQNGSFNSTSIDSKIDKLNYQIEKVANEVRETEKTCVNSIVGDSTANARLAIAEAMAAKDRAEALKFAFTSAPVSIVNAVCSIDSAAFIAAQGGVPDATSLATAIGKVGPQPKPSGSSGATQPNTLKISNSGAFLSEQVPTKKTIEPIPSCKDSLNQLTIDNTELSEDRKELADIIGNINWSPLGFADCLKAANSPATPIGTAKPGANTETTGAADQGTKANGPSTLGAGTAGASFQVGLSLLGWMPLRTEGTTGTVTVSGGLQPYRWYVVDPSTYVVQASQDASTLVLNLKATKGQWRHRVLITDYAGNEVVVDTTPE